MPTESEYGHRIRELERQVTVLEQQIKQATDERLRIQADMDDMHADAKAARDTSMRTLGVTVTTLVGIVVLLVEQIVLHAAAFGKAVAP